MSYPTSFLKFFLLSFYTQYWLKLEITFWLIQKAKKSYSDLMPRNILNLSYPHFFNNNFFKKNEKMTVQKNRGIFTYVNFTMNLP